MTISIHALREEGDLDICINRIKSGLFLSTPSARRATASASNTARFRLISIHALREEGDLTSSHLNYRRQKISIHALREEGDPRQRHQPRAVHISIHALREEGDS